MLFDLYPFFFLAPLRVWTATEGVALPIILMLARDCSDAKQSSTVFCKVTSGTLLVLLLSDYQDLMTK